MRSTIHVRAIGTGPHASEPTEREAPNAGKTSGRDAVVRRWRKNAPDRAIHAPRASN